MKKKVAALVIGTAVLGTSVSEASDRGLAAFGAVAAIVTTAAVLSSQSRHSSSKRHYKKRSHRSKKRSYKKRAVVVTEEMRVQKALASLGFYKGKIDGALNSYETRTAIRQMNQAYGISDNSYLNREARDQLIYLANLYDLDRQLHTIGNTKKRKGTRLQAALKVHGVYPGKIDGVVGKGTRQAIREYKRQKGMVPTSTLNPEETYDLVSSAIAMNDRNIQGVIGTLKVEKKEMPTRVATPSTPQAAPQPVETAQKAPTPTVPQETHAVKKVHAIMQGQQVEDEEEDFALPEA
jgi:peptidoglycan hydrolase-like protein with peptidoglycan-binding domain